ncbi:MAG TPA: right-handed parallel beta-helix repeat-containing protein [Rhodanobacteraceae bacterium]|nr:right-handed parallel beta-helix repeat-containing protein [Rhodanobacteraceae bacterium]
MTRSHKESNGTGRQNGLACTLAMALGLGAAVVAAASPPDLGTSPRWVSGLDLQQVPEEVLDSFAEVLAGQAQDAQPMAGTLTVTSCADSGSGTLRDLAGFAVSGDTIDATACSSIALTSGPIVVDVDSLTIQGTPGTGPFNPPQPVIDAQQSGRVFRHTGIGTLNLRDLYVTNGFIDDSVTGTNESRGGCIYSDGDVALRGTYVTGCTAESGNMAAGGGVFAQGAITLYEATWVIGNTVDGYWYAEGGGLFSGGNIVSYGDALVNTNTATVEGNGWARGGGIYAVGGIIGGGLTLEFNTVTGDSAQGVQGGGGYFSGAMLLGTSTVKGNHAVGSGSEGGGFYVGGAASISSTTVTENDASAGGGGLFFADNATVSTSTVSDNSVVARGGGIYAAADLSVETSTLADNTAGTLGGGVYVIDALNLEASNVTGNDAGITAGGVSAYGNVTIERSTIAGNTSPHTAGASLGNSATTAIRIDQTTISGNRSSDTRWGAGLYLKQDAIIRNSTITGNIEHNGTDTHYGAGISLAPGLQLTLSSSIVSGNGLDWGDGDMLVIPEADDIGIADDGGPVYDILGSHNMIGASTVTTPPDTIGQATGFGMGRTGLAALADNGGPTLTHMPRPDSLAIDNGTANTFSCDQRAGDFARVVGLAADIGAVEVQLDENPDRIFASGFELPPAVCE